MHYATITIIVLTLLAGSRARAQEWVEVFDPAQILTLNLEIDPADWDTVRHDTTNEIEVPGQFWADGETTPLLVSVRRKSSRALPSEADPIKVALKIDVNEFVGGQAWHSLTKLSLENGADTDPISEGLAWNLHEMATGPNFYPSGYHAGLAAWVRLNINGAYVGVFINVEERDSQFLRNRALPRGTTSGGERRSWLYEIDDLGAGSFDLEDGDLPHSPTWTALCYEPFTVGSRQALACPTPGDVDLHARLNELIDMPIMLTQGAVDAFSSNSDALFTHGKNFRFIDFNPALAVNAGRKRLYLSWDLDASITDVSANIYAQKSGRRLVQSPYQRVILNHPQFRAQYNAIIGGLVDAASGPLSESALHTFLDGVETLVTPALIEDPYAGFDSAAATAQFDGLRSWVTQRIANVLAQVAANTPAARQ